MSKRIAIVEDDATIRQNYGDALKRSGYEVEAYADRPVATAAFRTRLRLCGKLVNSIKRQNNSRNT